jgi:hypothetical protein
MKVRLLLANFAEVRDNMLYAMGAGWTIIGPAPAQFAIAALVETEWEETNRPIRLSFEIFDVDGQPLSVATPTGDRPFQIAAELSVGRPPDAPPGVTFLTPVAVNVQPLQFQPGQHYVLKASANGTLMDSVHFRVRSQPQPTQQRR